MKGLVTKPIGPARRLRLASSTAAVILGVLTLLAFVVDVPLENQIHTLSASSAFVLLILLPLVLVGVVVARREPGNPIGWLLMAVALLETLGADASDYSVFVYRFGHRGWPLGPVGVLLNVGPVSGLPLLPLVILLFPDGRLSARWTWALRTLRLGRPVARRLSRFAPPPLSGWTRSRELPVPPRQSFRDWWRDR